MQYYHTTEYCSAIKRNKPLIRFNMINLENIPSESQTQKTTYYMSPLISVVQKGKSIESKVSGKYSLKNFVPTLEL
jgi:hypothetical protein